MTVSSSINNTLHTLGITAAQAALVGGGFFLAFILPNVFPRLSNLAIGQMSFPFGTIGIILMTFGVAWFGVDRIQTGKSHYTSIYPPLPRRMILPPIPYRSYI